MAISERKHPDIHFLFEGKSYACGYEAYGRQYIVLPDGRVLAHGGWLEMYPPAPMDLRVIPIPRAGASAQEIATDIYGVLAREESPHE